MFYKSHFKRSMECFSTFVTSMTVVFLLYVSQLLGLYSALRNKAF